MNKPGSIGLAALLLLVMNVSTAQAGDASTTAKSTKTLGRHLTLMRGFSGTSPSTAQYEVKLTRSNGQVFVGTQRWRDCAGYERACNDGSTAGSGWTAPEGIMLVRTSPGTFMLRSANGQGQIVLGERGITSAYFLGGGGGVATRSTTSSSASGYSQCGVPCVIEEVPPPPPPDPAPPAPPMSDPSSVPPPPPA